MLAVAAAFAPHEIAAEVQIRLVLIMSPAAQRDVAHLMLSAFPIGLLVMVLHAARASAATALFIDERATATVASPYLTSDRCRDGSCSAIATSTATLIAEAASVGDRRLLSERIVEQPIDGAGHDDRGVCVSELVAE